MLALALGEIAHRRLHQIKLLLQVVETDLGIETVPVQQFVLRQDRRGEFAINVLLVQNVEQRLKERYNKYSIKLVSTGILLILTTVREFLSEVGHLG